MTNRHIGDRSSETQSSPIDMNNVFNRNRWIVHQFMTHRATSHNLDARLVYKPTIIRPEVNSKYQNVAP
jgi:hypothetical protein